MPTLLEAVNRVLIELISARMDNPRADAREMDALVNSCVAIEDALYPIETPAPAGWSDLTNCR